jgi:hypothetical protein
MSLAELKLVLILIFLFFVQIRLLRLDPRRTVRIFSFACAIGVIAQLLLGRELNLYTPNITLYVSYVSVAVIMAWGAGLTSIWAIHSWLRRMRGIPAGLGAYTLCGIPVLIALEFAGSNIIKMKLHDYRQYAALMPYINAMHAPKWLYAYYVASALVFFYSSMALGIYGEDPNECESQVDRVFTACENERDV